jgi:hypothetical protein
VEGEPADSRVLLLARLGGVDHLVPRLRGLVADEVLAVDHRPRVAEERQAVEAGVLVALARLGLRVLAVGGQEVGVVGVDLDVLVDEVGEVEDVPVGDGLTDVLGVQDRDVEVGLPRGELGEHRVVPVGVGDRVDLDRHVGPLLGVLRVGEVLERLGRWPLEPDEAQRQGVVGELGDRGRRLRTAGRGGTPAAAAVTVTAAAGREGRRHQDGRRGQACLPAGEGPASRSL